MLRKTTALVLSVVFLLPLLLCSCSGAAVSDYPVTVSGVELSEAPQKVICLSNSFIEIIYALDYQSQLTGRSYSCKYEDAASLTPCGTADNPSTDVIKNMETDLILTDKTTPKEALDSFKEANIPYIIIADATNRRNLCELYSNLGRIFGGNREGAKKGEELIESLLIQMDDIERLVSAEDTITVCVIMDKSLTKCATGDTLVSMLLELAGGFNVAVEGRNWQFSSNDITRADPEVMLAPADAMDKINAKRDIQQVAAMLNQKVYVYDVSVFSTQYMSMVKSVWQMAHILHPELVTEEMVPEEYRIEEEKEDMVMTREEYDAYLAELEAQKKAEEEEE